MLVSSMVGLIDSVRLCYEMVMKWVRMWCGG